MGGYLIDNSKYRIDLEDVPTRIKFKTVFPTFEEWKDNLLFFKIPEADIKEEDFLFIQALIGNSMLRYKTSNKNLATIAFQFRRLLAKKKARKEYVDLTMHELLSFKNINTTTLYTIDRTADGDAEAKYVDNKVVNEVESNLPVIDRILQLQQMNEMDDAETWFIASLANIIVFPIPTTQFLRKEL